MKTRILAALAACLITGATVRAASYTVPAGSITDHSDPSIPNSLAWYFATYGGGTQANPNTFYLSTPVSVSKYICRKRIDLPAWARLTESADTEAYLECDGNNWIDSGNHEFIRLNTGSILLHVEVHCNWKPRIGVFMQGVNNAQVIDVRLHKTAKLDESYLIYVTQSSDVTINQCVLRRAGYDSTDPLNAPRLTQFIRLIGGSNITITNCDMSIAGSAGIGISNTVGLEIHYNTIANTGLGSLLQDGITCYNNQMGPVDRDAYITHNTIYNCRNHGVHVSGYGWHIENNKIYNVGTQPNAASNIYLGDYKTPTDCSANSTIVNNNLSACPSGGGTSIKIGPYKSGTITVSGNTGCTSILWGSTCN